MSIQRHSIYNLAGAILPLLLSLVTIPLYLDLIGEVRYGVLAIAWLLLGYFGLFDLGLGRATAQRIAVQRHASVAARAETFWTALILNTALGVIGGCLIWPVANHFFSAVFQVDEAIRPEIIAAVPWLVLAVPLATLSGVLTGALQGREKFLALNTISVLGAAVFQLVPLAVAALWTVDLNVLVPAALVARLMSLALLFFCCKKQVFEDQPVSFSRETSGQLLRFGGWVTVSSFIGPLMTVLDRFVIGATIGAKAVSYYTVPYQLSEKSTILSRSLVSALFPRLATEPDLAHDLAARGLRLILVVVTPLVGIAVLLLDPFLAWWISPDFARESAPVGKILFIGFWLNSLAMIPFAQLQARGRPDITAACHLAELVPYLGLLYLGLTQLGLPGAAAAFSLRAFIDFLLLAGLAGILGRSYHLLIVPVLLIAAASALSLAVTGNPAALLGCSLGFLLVTACWAYWQAPDDLLNRVRAAAHAVFR